jgi:hypothetical protein
MNIFSTPQIVGYFSFVLGVAAFLQKTDRRLKMLGATQSLIYAVHFALLGNVPAAASAFISSTRTSISIKYRSATLAVCFVLINVTAGLVVVKTPLGWLTVVATCGATIAMFTLSGVQLRLVLLASTVLWLANNILTQSIGGTALELTIAVINIITTLRLMRASQEQRLAESIAS